MKETHASAGRAPARPSSGKGNDDDASSPAARGQERPRTRRSASLRPWQDALRKHPVHLPPREVHNRSTIVYVTTCTKDRRKILDSPEGHDAIATSWAQATTWLVGRYVIMPDHVHLFCAPNGLDAPALEKWMSYWKSMCTRRLGQPKGTVWQRHHCDRQLRTGESYGEKWDYVRNNPVRAQLVSNANEWPYQGELNELRW